jgi:HAD superfamily hydrolase (TIGR01484 family)
MIAHAAWIPKLCVFMPRKIRLLSTDFDGTLVCRTGEPFLHAGCMETIQELQRQGAAWAINTGRSVDLLESGLLDFSFPFRPDFILTSERDVFRAGCNGTKWEPYGDWNERCARDHATLFSSASSVLKEIINFVNRNTHGRIIYETDAPAGLIASSEEEMDRVVEFLERARGSQSKFHYQRNSIYLRFCHVDYHKGAALAELARLLNVPREEIFAAGDNHNDISMLDGKFAALAACPANAVLPVKEAVLSAGGYVAEHDCGAGVYEALLHFCCSQVR